MTQEEILAVKPGRELNSRDIEAADLVVDAMIRLGFEDAVCWADFGDGAFTEPEAIGKAALLAKLHPFKPCQ